MLQIHHGPNDKWGRDNRCYQVCSDKQGETNTLSTDEDDAKQSERPDYNEDEDQLEKNQEEENGKPKEAQTNQVF